MKNNNKKNAGQVALIILIISAIIMTLGLSISKKSVVETKITADEELLKQAFNTAESGIEYYLGTGSTGIAAYITGNNNAADVTVKDVGGAGNIANLNVLTLANELSFTWLVPHKDDGSLNWTQPAFGSSAGTNLNLCIDSTFKGAVKIDYFYQNVNVYGVKRMGYNVGGGNTVNEFTPTGLAENCAGIPNAKSIDVTSLIKTGTKPLLLVVKPIGNSTKIAFTSNATFPNQAKEISSLGQAGNPEARVNRNIKVINQYQLPSFLLEAVTASGDVLSK